MELGFHKTKIIIVGNSIMVICTTHLNVVFFLLFLYSEYPHSRTVFLYQTVKRLDFVSYKNRYTTNHMQTFLLIIFIYRWTIQM